MSGCRVVTRIVKKKGNLRFTTSRRFARCRNKHSKFTTQRPKFNLATLKDGANCHGLLARASHLLGVHFVFCIPGGHHHTISIIRGQQLTDE